MGRKRSGEIRYDKRILRALLITGVVLLVIVISVIPWMLISIRDLPSNSFLDLYMAIGIACFWPMVIIWFVYLDGKLYCSELEKAGYEIPYDRKQYGKQISNLPRTKELEFDKEGICRYSRILSVMAGGVAIVIFGFAIKYIIQWQFVEDAVFVTICLFVLCFLWLIGFYVYRKQSDNRKYRNFYEDEDYRKIRTALFDGIIAIIFLGAISFFLVATAYSFTRYIEKTRVSADLEAITIAIKNGDFDNLENSFRCKNGEYSLEYKDEYIEVRYSHIWEYGRTITDVKKVPYPDMVEQ